MFKKVMILLVAAAFVGGAFAPEAQAFGNDNERAEFGETHIGGAFAFTGDPDAHRHVPQRPRIGSVHDDLGVQGYGCLAHPDYGLYTPHFC
jgi:hypothetical protein